MAFGKKKSEQTFRCYVSGVRAVSCDGPPVWWLRLGCDHESGEAQVCDTHKRQIDQGDVPGSFTCPCGQPPVLTPVR